MGILWHFSLSQLAARWGLRYFVETGTWQGYGITHAAKHEEFTRLFSIEINKQWADYVSNQLQSDNRVTILNAASVEGLKTALAEIPTDVPCLFFLDAHFPEMYDSNAEATRWPEDVRLPLEYELEVIHRMRTEGKDVIIVDDLRVYKDGPYAHGNCKGGAPAGNKGIQFVADLFGLTHDCEEDYAEEGYLILTPKPAMAEDPMKSPIGSPRATPLGGKPVSSPASNPTGNA